MARQAGTKIMICPNPAKGKKACGHKLVVMPGKKKICPHCEHAFVAPKKFD
jgi:hypothetical protein